MEGRYSGAIIKQVPEVRLAGNCLQAAGIGLGQIFEVALEKGVLVTRAA